MKRCVVIPSYKAAATLRGGNDCSPDDTGSIADALAAEFPGVHAVHHPENKGFRGALKTGMANFYSGYITYSRRVLEAVPYNNLQNNYNFDAEMITMPYLAGMPCSEVPIPTKYDDETSSPNPIPYGPNVLKMILRNKSGHYRKLLEDHQTSLPGKNA
ncbi:glycosyltransferase [Verrucomicrobiales bacterium]|nr:glycosyltransferase [Verrucomicrobiales bacterium]